MTCFYCGKQLPANGQCDCAQSSQQRQQQWQQPQQQWQQPPGQPQQQQWQQPQQQWQQPAQPQQPPFNSYNQPAANSPRLSRSGSAAGLVKQFASSPLFLTALIVYSLFIVLQLIQALTGYNIVDTIIVNLYQTDLIPYEARYDMYEILRSARTGVTVASLLGLVIPVLTLVAMWMVFSSSLNRHTDGMSLSGFSMLKVLTIINLVFFCIQMAIILILCVIIVIAVLSASPPGGAIALLLLGCLIIFAVETLTVIYYVKIMSIINTVKMTVLTGTPHTGISMFVPVMSFILAFFALVSCFFSNTMGIFINLLNAAFLILISIVIIQYRSRVQLMQYGQRSTMPVNPPNPPFYQPPGF